MADRCYMIKYTGKRGTSLIVNTANTSRQAVIKQFMQMSIKTWAWYKSRGYSTALVEVREIPPSEAKNAKRNRDTR